jgi:SPX domain protein involved in polyphosphate accumulation
LIIQVRPENLTKAKLKILKHISISRPPFDEKENGQKFSSPSSPIASVYLDSADLAVYTERMKRHEGAALVRFDVIQGILIVIQGTFGAIQGTFGGI